MELVQRARHSRILNLDRRKESMVHREGRRQITGEEEKIWSRTKTSDII